MEINDIPNECWWVFCIQKSGQPIGMDMFNKCQDIIKRHPQHFPWETKYNSIPDSVHEGYRNEVNGGVDLGIVPIFKGDNSGVSVGSEKVTYKPLTSDDLRQFFKYFEDADERDRKSLSERKRIWKKWYRKFGLSYRDGY